MANITSANGTSKKTAAEIKEWYEKHKDTIERFEAIQNGKQLINPIKNETRTYTVFNRDTLRTYMKNPASYYKRLVELSKFLYTRSNPYRKLIHYNASMIDITYRAIIPIMDFTKDINQDKVMKDYWNTCKLMNRSNIKAEITKMLVIAWREDTSFGVWYADDTGVFILPLNYDICKVDNIYGDGTLGFSMDMSYFDQRQETLEYWGEPFDAMYREYEKDKTNGRWQHMPDDRAFCLKVNIDDPTLPLPPYVALFNSIINLADTEDLQATKDNASVYKMLSFELEPSKDNVDEFTVDIETAIDYFNRAVESLPDYVAAVLTPVKINPISFKDDQAADINIIENATKTLYNSSGGAQILNSASISTTIGWTSALIADEQYGTALLRPQVENNINRLVREEKTTNCKIKLFPCSPYTKSMYKEEVKSDNQYGIPLRFVLNALNGFSEIETLSMAKLENEFLNLNELFIPPQSANTMSGSSGEVGQGAPTKSPTELTDEGDSSRDKG